MAKQATSTWLHTGAATDDLSSMSEWTAPLLQHYHSNAKISTLRFGTSSGLEESGNGTSSGVGILRRDSSAYSKCLETYLADGTTKDAAHADKCDYDPQYTSWFQAAKLSVNSSTFSDTYDNSWLAAVSKACTGNDCSNGIAGVWASEWQISSISDSLAQLILGFEGSLAVIDFNGIVLATSSGITLEPALTCNDTYIRTGSKESVGNTKYFKKGWSGALLRETFIGVDVLSWLDFANFPEVSTQYFGMMALERRQLYREYEEARNTGLAAVAFGLIFMGLILDKFFDKTKSVLLHTEDRNKKIMESFEDSMESSYVKLLKQRFGLCIQTLAWHLESYPIQTSDLYYLDGIFQTNNLELDIGDKQELSLHEALRWVSISLLQDLAHQRDMELHLAILLCTPFKRRWLVPLFRIFSSEIYWLGTIVLLAALLWFELVEPDASPTVKSVLLALLCADGILCCIFSTIQSWRFEASTQDISGVIKLVVVPGRLKRRIQASFFYMVLLVIASCAHHTAFVPSQAGCYIIPLLILLRNEDIW